MVRKKVDKSGDKEVVRYYAASKVLQPEPVSNDELAKRLAFVSSLQVGDAQSVLVQLPDIIADYLASGRTVNIKGLGNFFPSITSEPVEEKDLNTLVAAAMEKPAVSEEQAAKAPAEEAETEESFQYQYPSIELFERAPDEGDPGAEDELKANAQKLVDTLESFGVRTRVLDISRGPSVTRYEVQPMAGVKISRITSLADDIALNLAVADVRMEAPIPGKPAVGIEVPNHKKTPVYIRSVFESQSFLRMTSPLGIALGKDIAGVAQVADLCKMPHLLIAGSTGSGKSVCVNLSLIHISEPTRP